MGKAEKANKAKSKKLGKWEITWIVLFGIMLLCLIFLLPLGIFLLIIFAIAFPISYSSKKEKNRKIKWGIPINSPKIQYYSGYDAPLSGALYFSHDDNKQLITFWEALPNEKKGLPKKIEISKNDILSFTEIGDIRTYQKTSGGGVSVGGAIVGAALMGGPGAILGGRKKTKTETKVDDQRKTVLVFTESGVQKTICLDHWLYEVLCKFCIEKKDAPIKEEQSKTDESDVSAQIEKLADLLKKGILTEEEFSSKKAELLARI